MQETKEKNGETLATGHSAYETKIERETACAKSNSLSVNNAKVIRRTKGLTGDALAEVLRISICCLISITAISWTDVILARPDIDQLSPSVVQVRVSDGSGSGTLVIYRGRAAVLTNRHVVEGHDSAVIAVLRHLDRPVEPRFRARLVVYAKEHDFAILELTNDLDGEPVSLERLRNGQYGFIPELIDLERTETAEVRRGDMIGILGYPGIGRNDLVYTEGILSSIQQGKYGSSDIPMLYRTNADIAAGNSGGFAFNQAGLFIGIPTAVMRESQTGGRLSSILPLPLILEVLNDSRAMSSNWSSSRSPQLRPQGTSRGRSIRLRRRQLNELFMEEARSGGDIDVAGLGPDCRGHVPNIPHFRLDIADRVPEILIGFIAADDFADTTIIVQLPNERFLCNDDAYENTFNPGVLLNQVTPGTYSIWIGSYTRGRAHQGMLVVGTPQAFDNHRSDPYHLQPSNPEPYIPGPSAPAPQTPTTTLNWRRPPTNGLVQLSPGFTPDPHKITLLAGGEINLMHESTDSSCSGWVSPASDYAVNWLGDHRDFYVHFSSNRPEDDATLMVRTPSGEWICNDDASRGTLNPMISISHALPGTHHIWIGSRHANESIRGQLHVTEIRPAN